MITKETAKNIYYCQEVIENATEILKTLKADVKKKYAQMEAGDYFKQVKICIDKDQMMTYIAEHIEKKKAELKSLVEAAQKESSDISV